VPPSDDRQVPGAGVDEDFLNPVRIETRIGPPIEAGALRERSHGNRRVIMDSIGAAIAAVLPPKYRGAYGGATR
jgi:hypothetical protein